MADTYPVPNEPSETTRIQLALDSSLPAIDAVPEAELIPINVDVPSAAMTALGAKPKLALYRADLARIGLDATAIDRLEPYALALLSTHASYLAASRPPAPITELVEAGTRQRDALHAAVVALEYAGVVGPEALDGYRGTNGYKTLVVDLEVLRQTLRRRASTIEGKTAVTGAMLEEVDMTIEQLATAIGEREQAPETIAAAALRRQKAFTLLASTYDVIRRGLTFLRWKEGDADLIAPSLYAGRNRGRRESDEAEAETPPVATVPVVRAPLVISPTAPATRLGPPGASDDIPAGMPGSSPFLRG